MNFGANDYLGLAGDSRIAEAAYAAAKHMAGALAPARPSADEVKAHADLEQLLAEYEHAEERCFSTGLQPMRVIPALVDDGDAIYADAKNHASLIDGCRLSRAERFVYSHADSQHLAQLLSEGHHFRRRLIVTDTLFSMGWRLRSAN